MRSGDVITTTHISVRVSQQEFRGTAGYKAEKGEEFVFIFLGKQARDGSTPLNPLAVMRELGWRESPQLLRQLHEEGIEGYEAPRQEMIYIVLPGLNGVITEHNGLAVTGLSVMLMRRGHLIYVPTTHSSEFGREYHKQFNRSMMERCDRVLVFTIEDWRTNGLVESAIEDARKLGLPVGYIDQSGNETSEAPE